jgi:hypothetical protein
MDEVIRIGVSIISLKDPSTVFMVLTVVMSLTHLKMILQWWERMLVQPGPLKKDQ